MSAVSFYVVGADGGIKRHGTCSASDLLIQAADGECVHEGVADCVTQYVVDGELRSYTPEEIQLKRNLPHGWSWKMPDRVAVDSRSLDAARAQAWERIKAARGLAESAPFVVDGAEYQANAVNIDMAARQALQDPAFNVSWRLADNTLRVLDGTGMQAVNAALFERNQSIRKIADRLRGTIDAANQVDVVDAIAWPA